jgi:hypothetical protein
VKEIMKFSQKVWENPAFRSGLASALEAAAQGLRKGA